MFEVTVDRSKRTLRLRASGNLTIDQVKKIASEAAEAVEDLGKGGFIVLADMRGMTPLSPEASEVFGNAIKRFRQRGTICCVHLSDSSIARLQTRRLAREASPYDDVTVDVVSLEEAEQVVQEKQADLRASAPRGR